MAISFACPGCKTLIQVGEEMAGQTGQCPRCEKLLIIPSAHTLAPILLDADGKPVPTAPPPARKPAPTIAADDDRPRSRRRALEKKPAGPTWPWAVGVVGAILVFILLFSSFITLFAYRPREVRSNLIVVEQRRSLFNGQEVTHGRLEGNRAFLDDNGVFQVRSAITAADLLDQGEGVWGRFRTKRFEIQLVRDKHYIIEVDNKRFSSFVRLENRAPNERKFQNGGRNAQIPYWCLGAGEILVGVGNLENVDGEFTLTIRESHLPKPNVP